MKTNVVRDGNRQWIGRLALTIVVGCAASCTVLAVSGALKTVEQMDRVDSSLSELSFYVADGHASIRGRMTTLGSFADEVLVRFDTGVERRMARLRHLARELETHTSASVLAPPLRGNVDVQRVEEERRAYVTAATATGMTPLNDLAMRLRLFDLHAQKLVQTVEAVRDNAAAARARALLVANGIVELSSAIGVLLIVCLIWSPVAGGARHTAALTPPIDSSVIAFHRPGTGWLRG
jgi:hypothetical protein